MSKKEPKYVLLVKGVGEIPVRNRKHAQSQMVHWQAQGKEGQDFLVFTPGGARVPLVLDQFGHYVLTAPVGEEAPVDGEMYDAHQAKVIKQAVDTAASPDGVLLSLMTGKPNAATQAVIDGRLEEDEQPVDPAPLVPALSTAELIQKYDREPVEPLPLPVGRNDTKAVKKAKRKKFAEVKAKMEKTPDPTPDEPTMISIERDKLADLYQERNNWRNRAEQLEDDAVSPAAITRVVDAAVADARKEWQEKHDDAMIQFGLIPVGVLVDHIVEVEDFRMEAEGGYKIVHSYIVSDAEFNRTAPMVTAMLDIRKRWEQLKA